MTASSAPAPAESSAVWVTKPDRDQDRWALTLPGNVLSLRYASEYEAEHGALPGLGWTPPSPPEYVKVTTSPQAGKARTAVLRTKVATGSDLNHAAIAVEVFGEGPVTVSLRPAGKRQFRFSQLRTTGNRLQIAAVVLGGGVRPAL